jgi:hypothetical protein
VEILVLSAKCNHYFFPATEFFGFNAYKSIEAKHKKYEKPSGLSTKIFLFY